MSEICCICFRTFFQRIKERLLLVLDSLYNFQCEANQNPGGGEPDDEIALVTFVSCIHLR